MYYTSTYLLFMGPDGAPSYTYTYIHIYTYMYVYIYIYLFVTYSDGTHLSQARKFSQEIKKRKQVQKGQRES